MAWFEADTQRPPAAVFDRGNASLERRPSKSKLLSVRRTSSAVRLRRTGGLHTEVKNHPPLIGDRADSGPLIPFSSLHSVGMAGRPIPTSLQSEKRAQRPNLGATLRLHFVPPKRWRRG